MLQGLTQVEEMLISAVMPIMSIYRLPQGQYGYSGHVINLPQDVISFTNNLPRLPSQLDVLVVRKEGANQTHRDFQVRRSVVLQALQWLIAHNKYYCANNVHINQHALAQLPQDGTLPNISSIKLQEREPVEQQPSLSNDDPACSDHLAQSFVPIAARSLTEQESIRQAVQDRPSYQPPTTSAMWPTIGGTPINEFTTEDYFSYAFPTLFPTGAADFSSQRRN